MSDTETKVTNDAPKVDLKADDDGAAKKKGYKNNFPKRDQPSWKRNGRGHPRGDHNKSYQNSGQGRRGNNARRTFTDALIKESMMAREDKPLIFDLSSGRSKLELNDWFKTASPTKIRRSDGVGWIVVLSDTVTEADKKNLFETYEGVIQLRDDWHKISEDPEAKVTFDTFETLAKKHNNQAGKWIHHPKWDQIDEVWQRLVLDLAYGKFPKDTIALKISPINDLEIPGANSSKNDHVVCIINRHMDDFKEVCEVEKALRGIPLRGELQYKPDIYSRLGIYRGNKYKIRPTIYTSIGDGEGGFKVVNVAKDDWHYTKVTDETDPKSDDFDHKAAISDIQTKLAALRQTLDEIDDVVVNMEDRKTKIKKMMEECLEEDKEPIKKETEDEKPKKEEEKPAEEMKKEE